ncbi:MAG TPA: AI-2E family transporter [Sphaerochaeta sp.]|nr:AI-2E family transporter [Sphaerochaeta sp.]
MKIPESLPVRQISKLLLLAGTLALVVVRFATVISFIEKILDLLTPLIMGCVMAFLVDLLVKPLERLCNKLFKKRRKLSRPFAILISVIIVVALFFGVLLVLIPQLKLAIEQFMVKLPLLFDDFENTVASFVSNRPEWQSAFAQLQSFFDQTGENIMASIPLYADYALGLVGSALTVLIQLSIGVIFSLYLLFGKRRLLFQSNRLLDAYGKPRYAKRIRVIVAVVNQTFSKFFAGQLLEALILGGLCTLGMMVFRFPYALTIGTVVGMTALIPMIGAYIGGAIGFVLIFPDNFKLALLFILFLVILQQLEGNLIYPRVVGNSVGLPGIWVFASIIIGGGLWGVLGIIFGVPTVASLYRLVRMDMAQRKKQAKNIAPSSEVTY